MLHPALEVVPAVAFAGVRVVAARPVALGTIVWVQDPLDRVLEVEALASLPAIVGARLSAADICLTYGGRRILPWDGCRSLNHRCGANVQLGVGPWFIAVADLAAGDEATLDYGTLPRFVPAGHAALHAADPYLDPCRCGASACRGVITPRAREAVIDAGFEAYARAVERADAVEQALASLLPASTVASFGRRPARPGARSW
jgi:hypothetical protein